MQITNHILMIEPVNFDFNYQTAKNNFYQKNVNNNSSQTIQQRAHQEFVSFVDKLKKHHINVISIKDSNVPHTPDSIFPNNWISFHKNSIIAIYPMFAENRRNERREDVIELIKNSGFKIENKIDFSSHETNEKFLEGTGSMVLDRVNKICYASLSERTNKELVHLFCQEFNYTPLLFTSKQNAGSKRMPIYHTNVMMSICDTFSIVCLEAIDNIKERNNLIKSLKSTNKEIIEINESQKSNFAGNMLQLMGDKPYLIMSSRSYRSLDDNQIERIKSHCDIIHTPLDVIETYGGGSARCMIAEIFLPKIK